MEIIAKKSYLKAFQKLSRKDRDLVENAIEVFSITPMAPKLRNHAFKWKYLGARSIDAGFDFRIIFLELSEGRYELVELLEIGTHSQLYGK